MCIRRAHAHSLQWILQRSNTGGAGEQVRGVGSEWVFLREGNAAGATPLSQCVLIDTHKLGGLFSGEAVFFHIYSSGGLPPLNIVIIKSKRLSHIQNSAGVMPGMVLMMI